MGRSRAGACAAAVLGALVLGAAPALAQSSRDDALVEAYLEKHALSPLLADHLAERLRTSGASERVNLVDRLGRLYAGLIARASTTDERDRWTSRAEEMLKSVPDTQAVDLRLDLLRQAYAPVENQCERGLLDLLTPEQRERAKKDLARLRPQLEKLAKSLSERAENAERASVERPEGELETLRRQRAIAWYYAGWAAVYSAQLEGYELAAGDALRALGWILGRNNGQPPSRDKLNKQLLKLDHVARACVGVALAHASLRNENEAMWWLDQVEESDAAPAEVKELARARRVMILARAGRWSDLGPVLKVQRTARAGGVLSVPVARLLAVSALSAAEAGDRVAAALANEAVRDLIEQRQLAHVLDLASRSPALELGDKGFVAMFVRGARQLSKASERHVSAGGTEGEASTDPGVVGDALLAAELLGAAPEQPDAGAFGSEPARALTLSGRALLLGGRAQDASARFERAVAMFAKLSDDAGAEEALWLAIVALERHTRVVGEHNAAPATLDRLDELALLYTNKHPGTPRAQHLLVRLAAGGKLDGEKAVAGLLAVSRDSPVYLNARRQAARLLYHRYRGADADARAFEALRFANVAEDLLIVDRDAALVDLSPAGKQAGERCVSLGRQMLDAICSGGTLDAGRAEGIVGIVQRVGHKQQLLTPAISDELLLRRVQILLARGQSDAARDQADELAKRASVSGPDGDSARRIAPLADRALVFDAQQRWAHMQRDGVARSTTVPVLRTILASGQRALRVGGGAASLAQDQGAAGLQGLMARAAIELHAITLEREALDMAVRLDTELLAARPGQRDALERLAQSAEAAGNLSTSLECWRQLALGLEPASMEWARAKFNHFRLLSGLDSVAAREALRQHALLYPDLGPSPWGEQLRALQERLAPAGGNTP